MSGKTKTQTAQVEAKPQRVLVSGYPAQFFAELQQLVREGYSVVLTGGEAPHSLMDGWQTATLVLEPA